MRRRDIEKEEGGEVVDLVGVGELHRRRSFWGLPWVFVLGTSVGSAVRAASFIELQDLRLRSG